MLAEEMTQMADAIEGGKSFEEVVKEFISKHKRIIFNGDGYSAEWEEEAKDVDFLTTKTLLML